MTDFITCPFCSGHEAVSPEAAAVIAKLIEQELPGWLDEGPLLSELENIRNMILNTEERATEIDPLLE
jgi:hypothetical protein